MTKRCPNCKTTYEIPDGVSVRTESTLEADNGNPRAGYAVWPVNEQGRPIFTNDPLHMCRHGVPC